MYKIERLHMLTIFWDAYNLISFSPLLPSAPLTRGEIRRGTCVTYVLLDRIFFISSAIPLNRGRRRMFTMMTFCSLIRKSLISSALTITRIWREVFNISTLLAGYIKWSDRPLTYPWYTFQYWICNNIKVSALDRLDWKSIPKPWHFSFAFLLWTWK